MNISLQDLVKSLRPFFVTTVGDNIVSGNLFPSGSSMYNIGSNDYPIGTLFTHFLSNPTGIKVLSDLSVDGEISQNGNIVPLISETYDLGSAGSRWKTLYVKDIVAATITGTSISGSIWRNDSADMYIYSANAAADRTLYVANDGAGSYKMNLDVEGNIIVGGNVDGVDISTWKSSYDSHVASANAHHNQSHVLATTAAIGPDHTVSGLTAGQYLRATGATTVAFQIIPDIDLPATIVRTSRTITAGAGLTGGGDLSADRTLAVGAGTMITVNADDVQISSGANYQFIGTGAGTAAGWRNVSELAGAGLVAATGILAVGAGLGITVNVDDIALTTPGSLSATSTNSSTGSHTHAIDSTIARSAITFTAGAGLTGGGDLTANRTFAVGAGTLITVNADDVALSNGIAQYQVPMTGATPFAPAWTGLGTLAGDGIAFGTNFAVELTGTSGLELTGVTPNKTLQIADTIAGNGLTIASKVLSVGAGTLITVAADSVGLAVGSAQYQVPVTGANPYTPAWTDLSTFAGFGLSFSVGAFHIGAGTLISVAADSVSMSNGSAQYQVPVTGSTPFTPAWTALSTMAGTGMGFVGGAFVVNPGDGITVSGDDIAISLSVTSGLELTGTSPTKTLQIADTIAGDGLVIASKVLAVGAGNGITVSANAVALTTPGTLTVSTTNNSAGSHTHQITSSSAPGVAASILASDATGKLTLPLMVASTSLTTPLVTTGAGVSLALQPTADLILDPDSNIVRSGAGVSLQASSYASQVTGWRVTDVGEADFRYLFVDEMHAKSFIADLEQALAGGQIIAKSVATLGADFVLPAAGLTGTLRVKDLPSAANMAVFESGDFIGLRQFSRAAGSLTIAWAWGTVTTYVDGAGGNEGTQTWTFTRHATTPGAATGTIGKDAIVLDFGVTGNGYYEVNAIDGLYGANSPYAQIVTWATHPATQTVRTRFGNLRGITSQANEFGIFAGSGTAVTDRYIRASSYVLELRNVPLNLYDGSAMTMQLSAGANNNSPYMALGSPLPTAPLTNNGIWLGLDSSVYKFRVGNVNTGALTSGMYWDGSALLIGSASAENFYATGSTVQMRVGSTVHAQLASSTLTLGVTSLGDYITIDGTNGVRLYANATLLGQWTAAGGVVIGEDANSKSRVSIASGAINMISKSGAGVDTTFVNMTVAGVLTLGDASNENVVVDTTGVALKDGASVYGKFAATTTIGLTSGTHVSITSSAFQIKDSSTVYTNLTAGALTLGNTAAKHIVLDSSGLALNDATVTYGKFAATTTIGATTGKHVSVTSTLLEFKDNTTVYASLSGTDWTLGTAAGNNILINSSGVSLKNGSTVYGIFAATTTLGVSTTKHIDIASTYIRLIDNTTTYVDLTGSTLTFGVTSGKHVIVDTSGVSLKDSTTVYGVFAATTTIGVTTSENVLVNATSVQIRDGSSVYTDLTGGALTLGLVANSYSRLYLNSGAISFISRSAGGADTTLGQWTAAGGIVLGEVANSKSRIEITSGAINIINRSGAGADTTAISLLANGNASFAGSITSTSGTIGGFTIGATSLTAGSGVTTVGLDVGGTNPAFYAGSATPGSAPFRVTNAGVLTSTSGTIGGWTIGANLSATNLTLIPGAANAANITAGTGATAGGLNAAGAAGDIVFWAGNTHALRASAPFRITAAGALTATTGTIAGDFSVTGSGKILAGGGGVVVSATGINIGLYPNLPSGQQPTDDSKAITWWVDPSNPSGNPLARIYTSYDATPGNGDYWMLTVSPGTTNPHGSPGFFIWQAHENFMWFQNITNVTGIPGAGFATSGVTITGNLSMQGTISASNHVLPSADVTYNLGSAAYRWSSIYANNLVISGTISGTTLSGGEWEYAGSMIIDANSAATTTVSVVNQGAGVANLDVENNITLGGTVDGVDIASFKSTYDSHYNATAAHGASDAVVGTTNTQTLSNKTLTLPKINDTSANNTYNIGVSELAANRTITLPLLAADDVFVFASFTQTLANKTLTTPTIGDFTNAGHAHTNAASGGVIAHGSLSGIGTNDHAAIDTHILSTAAHGATGAVVGTTNTQTLTNKTLTTPVIGDFTSAQHAHTGAASGGTIAHTSLTSIGTNTHAQIDTHIGTADTHVAHSTVDMIAGNGLTGGGTIAASRTFAVGVANTGAAGLTVEADAIRLTSSSNPGAAASILATDASGQVTLVRAIFSAGWYDTGNIYTYNALADRPYAGASEIGTMKIVMPKSWSNTMMTVRIVGYDYGAIGGWECIISGYNYAGNPPPTSQGWFNCTVEIRGSAPFSSVRLAHDGTYCCILLGTLATVWNYPWIKVAEMRAGFLNVSGWETGWSITKLSAETGITNIVTPTVYQAPPGYRNLTAGAGLTGGGDLSADRTFTIGQGAGITVNADDVALTTPGTLTASTVNSSTGSHTHAITSSSNPGAATQILKTDTSGYLQLVRLGVGRSPATYGLEVQNGLLVDRDSADSYIIFARTATAIGQIRGATLGLNFTDSSGGGSILMVDTTNNRVGINTSAPSYPLHVTGSGKFTGSLDVDVQFLGQAADTASAPSFSWTGDTNTGLYRPAENNIGFATAGAERARFDSVGRFGVNTTSPVGYLSAVTNATYTAGLHVSRFTNDPTGPFTFFRKARGTESAPTSVVAEDHIYTIYGQGYSTAAGSMLYATAIASYIDGEPETAGDTTDMPGRIVFFTTPNGSNTLAERMRIDSAGNVAIGTEIASEQLTISKAGNVYATTSLNVYSSSTSYYPYLSFLKSRSATIDTLATTVDGDNLGGIFFRGVNANASPVAYTGARIMGVQEGAAGASYVPARISFWTSDGVSALGEVARISPAGHFALGTTDVEAWSSSYVALQIGGNGAWISATSQGAGNSSFITHGAYYDGAWKYRSTASDEAIYISLGNGALTIGTAPADVHDATISWTSRFQLANTGEVTITSGASGATANSAADDLVIHGSSNTGITILTPNTQAGSIRFGDPQAQMVGSIIYDHPSNYMAFTVNSAEVVRINSGGNVGFSTIDLESWSSSFVALELGAQAAIMAPVAAGASSFHLMANTYYDGSWKYKTTNGAAFYSMSPSAGHVFRVAASGTADAVVTYTDAMTINLTGNVGIGGAPGTEKVVITGDLRTSGDIFVDGGMIDFGTNTITEGTALQFTGSKDVEFLQKIKAASWSMTTAGVLSAVSAGYSGAVTVTGDLTVGANVLVVNSTGTRVGINRAADAQFDLDVAGPIRGTYLIGKHAIQLPSAVGVWHFDGAEPYRLDYNGTLNSHLGNAAATSGGAIHRPGRYGKGIQLAEATTNLVTNPSYEVAAYTYTIVGGSTALNDDAYIGNKSMAVTFSNGAGAGTTVTYAQLSYTSFSASTTYALQIRYKIINNGGSTFGMYVTGSEALGGDQTLIDDGQWHIYTRVATKNASAGTEGIRLYNKGNTLTSAAVILVDAYQIEQKSFVTPYCDGTLGQGHTWATTEHASTSSRTVAELTVSSAVSRSAYTVMGWFKVYRGEGDTEASMWRPRFFQVGTYNTAASMTLGAYSTNTTVNFYIRNTVDGSWTANGVAADLDYNADEWIFLAVSYDGDKHRFYCANPNVADTDAKYFVLYEDSSRPGFYGTGADQDLAINDASKGMDLLDELVILDYAADTDLIRAIYESDAPVFVESSVFHWRAPGKANIWVDELGLWASTVGGNQAFGLYTGDPTGASGTKSWGGITMDEADLVLGSVTRGGAFYWDDSAATIKIGNPGAEHIAFDGAAIKFINNSTEVASLNASTWVLGDTGGSSNNVQIATGSIALRSGTTAYTSLVGTTVTIGQTSGNHVLITATTLDIKYNTTSKISLDASGNASFTGAITAASGTVGGWTIGANLSATNLTLIPGAAGTAHIFAGTGSTAGGVSSGSAAADIILWAGSTHAGRGTAPFRVEADGTMYSTNAIVTGAVTASSGSITGAFSVGAALTIGTSGTIVSGEATWQGDGFQLEYNAGNPRMYIGDGGVTSGDKYIMWDGTNLEWRGANTSLTAAGAFTATNATITGAITASSGSITGAFSVGATLTVGTSGLLVSGATTYAAGTGFVLDYNAGTPRFRIGTTAGNRFTWDGTNIEWVGVNTSLTAAGAFTATNASITGAIDANSGTIGTLTVDGTLSVGTGGVIKAGATAYNTGTGFWFDYNGGTPRFFIGNSAGNKLTWDGTTLTIAGAGGGITGISGSNITTGTINASVVAVTNLSATNITTGTLDAARISAGTITGTHLSGTTLSALKADMGTLTAGAIVIGTTNKIWLNDAADGSLNIGGATKASAPFQVTAAGALTSTSGNIGGWDITPTMLQISASGSPIMQFSPGNASPYVALGTPIPASPFISSGIWYGLEEATTNLITNPSFETGTTGWSSYSSGTPTATRTRVTTQSLFGSYSYEIVKTGGAATTDRVGTYTSYSVTSGVTYTFSAWVKVTAISGGTQTVWMQASTNITTATTSFTGTSDWRRMTVTSTATANGTAYFYVWIHDASTATIYVDGAQLEVKGYASNYCDGTLSADHAWTGTAHASTSTRTAGYRLRVGTIAAGAMTSGLLWDGSNLVWSGTNTSLTAAGVFTASNANITGSITASSGSITGALTLGASGGIYQGSGTFASPTTGLKIWNNSGTGSIAGYNGGTQQWVADTDGKLKAGAGNVVLSSTGINIAASTSAWDTVRNYSFVNGSTVIGGMGAVRDATTTKVGIGANTVDFSSSGQHVETSRNAVAYLSAVSNGAGKTAAAYLQAAQYGNINQATIYTYIDSSGNSNISIDAMYVSATGGDLLVADTIFVDPGANIAPGGTAGTRAAMYLKGNKLIICFVDGATTRYKYLDLTGTGVTWVHTTTPP